MSLDIGLRFQGLESESYNITHNLNKMWKEAGIYDSLYNSKGFRAKDVIDNLEQGLWAMKNIPEYFKQFNSPNGWGTYEHAVRFLENVISEFKKSPDAIIWVSK